ncbi:MAG: DUF5721 family protein [Ruminococcus sp.]|jgi:hypothetical protein
MKAFTISEIKYFMSQLLLKDTFDHFKLQELTLTTNVTYTIDGQLHPDFYDAGEAELLKAREETHISWSEIRPFCFSLIKGKHTPLYFKIVFQLNKNETRQLLLENSLSLREDDIFGLYLNCQFDGTSLTCVTGTSLRFFTMDKSVDYAWDDKVTRFFKSRNITFESM